MKSGILVSVIVPICNVEQYLGRCIESILHQTYQNLEIILVDDGSTDKSSSICDKYATLDKRIKVIHKVNGGLVTARKEGISAATGEYIGFVDSDDYIEAAFYEVMLSELVNSNADFIHTGYIEEKNEKKVVHLPTKEGFFENNFDNSIVFIKNSFKNSMRGEAVDLGMIPSLCLKLFRKEFINRCYNSVPNNVSNGEDTINLAISLINAHSFFIKKVALYHYCRRDNSYTNCNRIEKIEEIWRQHSVLKVIFKNNNMNCLLEDLDEWYVKFNIQMLKKYKKVSEQICYHIFKNIEKIRGKKIILYGAGEVGQDYYTQISKYADCSIIAWVDRNHQKYEFDYRIVESIDAIGKYCFDYIVVAVKAEEYKNEVKNWLVNQGIDEKIILF